MKKKIILAVFATIVSIVFCSCSKDNRVLLLDNPKTIMNQNQNLTSSPFDSVGFLHNKICDHYKRYY